MPEPLNKNEIIEKIARRLKCSNCGRRYRPYDFSILEEQENIAVMKLICRDCRHESVLFAVVQRRRVHSMFSELEPEEWERFRELGPISRDEVVEMHRTMTEYQGDLGDVLEDPLPPEAAKDS